MRPPSVYSCFYSIARACERIDRYAGNRTLVEYLEDEGVQAIVERQFTIIGEALNRAIRHDPAVRSLIPDALDIIAFRNQLVHGYDTVDHEIVWKALTESMPLLHEQAKAILSEVPEPEFDDQ
ncbi:MAG: DUF86 domain-containing protein [Dehalococcoidia bacterium]